MIDNTISMSFLYGFSVVSTAVGVAMSFVSLVICLAEPSFRKTAAMLFAAFVLLTALGVTGIRYYIFLIGEL